MKVRVFHLDWSLANSDSLIGKMVSMLQAGSVLDHTRGGLRDSLVSKVVNRLFADEIDAYTHVATVDVGDLNDAFRLTNTIDWPWWENKGVDAIVEKTRSTSVGDLYLLEDGTLQLIRPAGLLEVPA
jgi:hypothetical protein